MPWHGRATNTGYGRYLSLHVSQPETPPCHEGLWHSIPYMRSLTWQKDRSFSLSLLLLSVGAFSPPSCIGSVWAKGTHWAPVICVARPSSFRSPRSRLYNCPCELRYVASQFQGFIFCVFPARPVVSYAMTIRYIRGEWVILLSRGGSRRFIDRGGWQCQHSGPPSPEPAIESVPAIQLPSQDMYHF